ncbi:hypothetical protein [Arthrobacter sp. SAFR-044]|uniref:hypothetical protein n=1 Tax=Arthrobacter sp. SAFR-044 TaxID=3387278 RepID=UPI003F7BC0A1
METTPPPESRPTLPESRPPETRLPETRPLEGARLEGARLEDAPPDGTGPPPSPGGPGQMPGAPNHKGASSLVLAILAPVSMFLTAPFAGLAMLLTYSDNGRSPTPWVTPFVLFSLPLLFASLGLRLALPALKQLPQGSGSRSAAAIALCICGVVFALALGPALDLIGVF